MKKDDPSKRYDDLSFLRTEIAPYIERVIQITCAAGLTVGLTFLGSIWSSAALDVKRETLGVIQANGLGLLASFLMYSLRLMYWTHDDREDKKVLWGCRIWIIASLATFIAVTSSFTRMLDAIFTFLMHFSPSEKQWVMHITSIM